MSRTILIHLNVETREDDPRTEDEIADLVLTRIEYGLGGPAGSLANDGAGIERDGVKVTFAMAEEV